MKKKPQFARCTSCGAVGNTDNLLERGTCGKKCEAKVRVRVVKAWAVVMPEDFLMTTQFSFSKNEFDHDAPEPKYLYYYEAFFTKKAALKRKSWIVEPKKCKVVPVTISYTLPAKKSK